MSDQLDLFESQQVAEGTLILSSPNSALRKALKYSPQHHAIGDTVRLVLDVECVGVLFERTGSDTDYPLRRVHVMKVVNAHA